MTSDFTDQQKTQEKFIHEYTIFNSGHFACGSKIKLQANNLIDTILTEYHDARKNKQKRSSASKSYHMLRVII